MPVSIVEVGLRDGLQNVSRPVALSNRWQMVKRLSSAGLKRMELGSFVSHEFMPQMRCVPALAKKVLRAQDQGLLPKEVAYSAFVPNQRGFERALACGLKELSLFVSCTESFSQKNIRMSIKQSLKNLKLIGQSAFRQKIKIRVYLSVAFFCPYEGRQRPSKVVALSEKIRDSGVFEISISDTVGRAVRTDVSRLLDLLLKKVPAHQVALHFHDTRGMALVNVMAGLERGVRVFDSSIGGMGGCPYAPGATGNVATEELAYMLEKMNFKTDLSLPELIKTTHWLENRLKLSLPSRLSRAGL